MKICLITSWYNEEFIAPFFLNHYKNLDRVHILLEKCTDDKTREICAQFPNVYIEEVEMPEGIDDQLKVDMINNTIKKLDEFDWLYVVDSDELIWPSDDSDPHDFLARVTDANGQPAEVVNVHMWQIYRHWTEKDLDPSLPPLPQRQHGDPDIWSKEIRPNRDANAHYNKPAIFKQSIKPTFGPGNHEIFGTSTSASQHYKGCHWQMADPKLAIARRMRNRNRLSENNKRMGYGFQNFNVDEEWITSECDMHTNDSFLPIIYNVPNMGFLKYLTFEINDLCQLTKAHPMCARNFDRFGKCETSLGPITSDDIVNFVKHCEARGFNGILNMHNYNEPLLTKEIIFDLQEKLPGRKFSVWSNGVSLSKNIPENDYLSTFYDMMITCYPGITNMDVVEAVKRRCPNVRSQMASFDDRSSDVTEIKPVYTDCRRPDWELIIDYYGNGHMCCADWSAKMWIGNIKSDNYDAFLESWNWWREKINSGQFELVCQECLTRSPQISRAG